MRVFISYSTKDLAIAQKILGSLNHPIVSPFLAERDVQTGQSIRDTVAQAIRNADLTVLLWGKNASQSSWVPHEVGMADGRGIPILPVLLDGDVPLPDPIGHLKYLRADTDGNSAAEAVANLVSQHADAKMRKYQSDQDSKLGLLLVGGLLAIALSGGAR